MRRWMTRLITLAALLAAAGCYKHVIRSEGLGPGPDEVYEPERTGEADPIDELMWGEPVDKKR